MLSGVGRFGAVQRLAASVPEGRVPREAVVESEIALLHRFEFCWLKDNECEDLYFKIKSFSFSEL